MIPLEIQFSAKRWVKFPATVLFATGVLWLMQSYFELDWESIKQQTETGLGSLAVITDLVIIPLGSIAVGVGLFFLQRWAIWLGFVLPVLPLLVVTIEKLGRIEQKFAEYRLSEGGVSSFGGGVMTAILVLALWGIYVVIVIYLAKTIRILDSGRAWLKRPVKDGSSLDERPPREDVLPEFGEVCQLFPEVDLVEESQD